MLDLLNIYIQGVTEVMEKTLKGDRGHRKDSELHSKTCLETSWESSMTCAKDEET